MIGFLYRLLIGAFGLWLASKIVPGLTIRSWETLLLAALLLGIVNALVRPIVVVLTLPITFLTLGLFLVVVNAFMLWLVSLFLHGFTIDGFWPAVWGAVVTGLVSWFASGLRSDMKIKHRIEIRRPRGVRP